MLQLLYGSNVIYRKLTSKIGSRHPRANAAGTFATVVFEIVYCGADPAMLHQTYL
jgi:hypothetical protein